MFLAIFFIYFFFILIEGTLTTLPIVLLLLLNTGVFVKKAWILAVAFLSGLALDILSLNTLSKTSLFFVIFTFILFMYDRKFEIQTYPFVFVASFLGSFLYLLIFGQNNILIQSFLSSIIGALLFFLVRKINLVT